MGWLIGTICVVIAICFWRIFLPLGLVAGVVLGGFLLYEQNKTERKKEAEAKAAQQLQNKVAVAQKNASAEGRKWVVYGRRDPASYKIIARTASITSNDGLCKLTVQNESMVEN